MQLENGNVWISETYLNADKEWIFGESGVYETWTNDTGKLFRECLREYGRCISSVYQDTPNDHPVKIGWVFQRREYYEDTGEPYFREVWVTLHQPEVVEVPTTEKEHPVLVLGKA